MQVRLEQVRERPFHWDETETVDAKEIGNPDVQALSPVRWRGEIQFADPGYLLTATYSYQQTLSCQRCLEPVVDSVEQPMQLLLVPGAGASERAGGGEHELSEAELGVAEVPEDGEVDLRPLLLEQIQLNVPMKPLCRTGCQGLCPQCGANRNAGECGCQTDQIDPRWQALAAFKERKKDDH